MAMADPLSITASVLAITTAAIVSTRSLKETVKRFRNRDITLGRLQSELEDLENILDKLKDVPQIETSVLGLLKDPVGRCAQLCRDFETSMTEFYGKSKTGLRDWAKLEFMRGDINDFIETLRGYQLTISVGLGTITLHTTQASHQILEQYIEVIKDAMHSLNIQMQRINEKLAQSVPEQNWTADTDLEDERAVTEQCLRVCEDARAYIESLTNREPVLHKIAQESTPHEDDYFEAQALSRKVINESRENLTETISRLRARLESLPTDGTPESDRERHRLQQDIRMSKQCLEVCKIASDEVSRQKIYRVGEAIADGDSDQVVVTTLADLFDVKKALSKGKSSQLIGSMTDETLRKMSEDRYNSRFSAFTSGEADSTVPPSALDGGRKLKSDASPQSGDGERQGVARSGKVSPNETRKRRV